MGGFETGSGFVRVWGFSEIAVRPVLFFVTDPLSGLSRFQRCQPAVRCEGSHRVLCFKDMNCGTCVRQNASLHWSIRNLIGVHYTVPVSLALLTDILACIEVVECYT